MNKVLIGTISVQLCIGFKTGDKWTIIFE